MSHSNASLESLRSTTVQTVDALSDLQQRLAALLLTEHFDSPIFARLARIESDLAAIRNALDSARQDSDDQVRHHNTDLLARFRALPDHVIARILIGLMDADPTYQEQLAILVPDLADKSRKMAGLRNMAQLVP